LGQRQRAGTAGGKAMNFKRTDLPAVPCLALFAVFMARWGFAMAVVIQLASASMMNSF